MNIGLFTDTYYPEINGVATSVLMLKEGLEKLGHCVYVFTTTNPDAVTDEHNVYRVPSIPFNVRRLGTFINPHLKSIIKKLKLDIIHTNTEFSLGIFGNSLAQSLEIPFVHTMHTIYEDYTNYVIKYYKFEPVAKVVIRKITAFFCNTADRVIVPTEKVKDLLIDYGVSQSISVIPSGIKLDKFYAECSLEKKKAVRAELGINENDKVIVNIGRVSKEKNLDEILNALANYLPQHSDVKLLLVGDGPATADLVKLSENLNIKEQVIFAGARLWDEIGIYYKLGDVFVTASLSETQGLTNIEALASGLPVVAKSDRCLDGVLEDGGNGYIFHDNGEFIDALDKVLFNDLERERLSQNALQTANKFSDAHFAESIASLYQEMLSNKDGCKFAS